ncbi:MAG: GerA spore germination protein, partial [Paenibacillaceae bacterium]|nr:GerA spore germination protein [Paenibacillaceae bacterium]
MASLTRWFMRKPLAVESIKEPPKIEQKDASSVRMQDKYGDVELNGDLDATIHAFMSILGDNDDFVVHSFRVFGKFKAALFYYKNFSDAESIDLYVLRPLMFPPEHIQPMGIKADALPDILLQEVLYTCEGKKNSRFDEAIREISKGKVILAIQGMPCAIVFGSRKVEHRTVGQPETEQVIRGAREGFIEMLGTNVSLLRYRLPTPDFRVKYMTIGKLTQSMVAICYIDGIANSQLVEEVHNRLASIEIDAVLDIGYLEQFIEDNNWSPFPQMQYTERPDKTVSNLIEGRVALLVDGSPFALIAPTVFSQYYQTVEDYSGRFLLVSFIRLARLIALLFSLVFPSLYVALLSFNPELIPTEFAVAVSGGRAGVPFPAVIEVLAMEISMEVLREATLRLPQQVGGALSIVGVLVIGQAAVSAGFVSPITVVVIALTTIGSFATPAYDAALALRILRFPLIMLAGAF